MQLRTLFNDDKAVVSMLGITILLGTAVVGTAVVGAFVLDVGGAEEHAPQVKWEFSQSADGVVVQHDGGDVVNAGQVQVRGDVERDYAGTTLDDPSLFGAGSVSAGDSATIDSDHLSGDRGTVILVWESTDGSQSTVLKEYEYDLG